MLRGMIKKVKTSGSLFAPSLRMVICIPSGSTNVEIRAVRDSAEHAGGPRSLHDLRTDGCGAGRGPRCRGTRGQHGDRHRRRHYEIACISLGGIVCSESINTAGDVFTNDIQSYVRQQHNIRIGERTAEAIKCSIGAAVSDLDEEPEDYVVTGPNMLTALPQTVSLSYSEIAYALEKSLTKIDAALMKVLESMPPTVCRHCEERHLPGRRRCADQGARQAPGRKDGHPVPRGGGPLARYCARYGYRAEEHQPFLILDEIVAACPRFAGTGVCSHINGLRA